MATIRRVPAVEHHYNLVITRVYDEGDQELLEDEDESEYQSALSGKALANVHAIQIADEERTFLIGEELQFRVGQTDGEVNFMWRDLEGDVDEFYEFVAPGTNEPTKILFEQCAYQAMYERKYKTSAANLKESDLEEFVWG
jgi:hypothetical protein